MRCGVEKMLYLCNFKVLLYFKESEIMTCKKIIIGAMGLLTMMGCGQPTGKSEESSVKCEEQSVETEGEAATDETYDLEAIAQVIKGGTTLRDFENGVGAVWKDGGWIYFDRKGHIVPKPDEPTDSDTDEEVDESVIPKKYDSHGQFHEGMCWVFDDETGGYGYIDTTGKLVVPCQYDWAVDHSPMDFHEGLCAVMVMPDREAFGYIDKTGKRAFPGVYGYEADFSEGLAGVRELIMDGDDVVGNHSGYIDHTGKFVIEIEGQGVSCWRFSDGVAKIIQFESDYKCWFIDKTGKKLFDLSDNYYCADDHFFKEGLCIMTAKDGTHGYFDKTGRSTFDYK